MGQFARISMTSHDIGDEDNGWEWEMNDVTNGVVNQRTEILDTTWSDTRE